MSEKFHGKGFVILIADDQKFMLKTLERYFRSYFDTMIADSFDRATEILSNHRVGVIISDHQMIDGQGIKLLEYTRDHFPDTRRVVITADRNEDVVLDFMSQGLAHSFVYKPTDKAKLHVVVEEQAKLFLENK